MRRKPAGQLFSCHDTAAVCDFSTGEEVRPQSGKNPMVGRLIKPVVADVGTCVAVGETSEIGELMLTIRHHFQRQCGIKNRRR